MSETQFKRLCEVDPEHFSDDVFNRNNAEQNLPSICWWMLTRLPSISLTAFTGKPKWICIDLDQDRFIVTGPTPEDAVIEAYIQWMEGSKNAER